MQGFERIEDLFGACDQLILAPATFTSFIAGEVAIFKELKTAIPAAVIRESSPLVATAANSKLHAAPLAVGAVTVVFVDWPNHMRGRRDCSSGSSAGHSPLMCAMNDWPQLAQ